MNTMRCISVIKSKRWNKKRHFINGYRHSVRKTGSIRNSVIMLTVISVIGKEIQPSNPANKHIKMIPSLWNNSIGMSYHKISHHATETLVWAVDFQEPLIQKYHALKEAALQWTIMTPRTTVRICIVRIRELLRYNWIGIHITIISSADDLPELAKIQRKEPQKYVWISIPIVQWRLNLGRGNIGFQKANVFQTEL